VVTAWRWLIGPWTGPPERELTLATNRQLTYTLTAPCTASFDLPGRSADASVITEMLTDLWVYADTTLVYRGRVIGLTDTVTAAAYTVTAAVTDYRGLLGRRLLVEGDQLDWSSATYAEIAWGLVQLTQAKAGGGLDIVQGVWQPDAAQPPSGYRVRNYQAGAEIGKTLDELAGVAFDYNIDPNLQMNLWAPAKTHASAFVADYGGTVVDFTRTSSATTWANVTRTSGEATSTVGDTVWTDSPEGRFEQQIGYPDVTLQATIDERAVSDHAGWLARRADLNLDLRPGVIESTVDLDVGDQIEVALRAGRLNVTGTRTVSDLGVTLDDTGVTHIRVGLVSA
jgi:hypothetical protein